MVSELNTECSNFSSTADIHSVPRPKSRININTETS
jgi:hypothetical protein